MKLYAVKYDNVKSKGLFIVAAHTPIGAIAIAKARFPSEGSWSAAELNAIVERVIEGLEVSF